MFLVNSPLDICFAVNTLSQFMVEPHHIHWITANNHLRYLRGTITYGLRYIVGNVSFHGYFDVDWASSVVDRKSTSGCCFSLGSASISWMSRKQKSVALRAAKAEYIVASMASCEVVWLRKLFSELFGHVLDTTVIYCDNQSGIRLSKNLVFHDRSKHIDIRVSSSPSPVIPHFEICIGWVVHLLLWHMSRISGSPSPTDSTSWEVLLFGQ
eukprot:PITA_27467